MHIDMKNVLTIHCKGTDGNVKVSSKGPLPVNVLKALLEELPKVVLGDTAELSAKERKTYDFNIQFEEGSLIANLLVASTVVVPREFSTDLSSVKANARTSSLASESRICALSKIRDSLRLWGATSLCVSSSECNIDEFNVWDTDLHSLLPAHHWFDSEGVICGQVVDAGGANSSNVHIVVPGVKHPIVAAMEKKKIAALGRNILYQNIVAHVTYRYCIETGKTKDYKILEFIEPDCSIDMELLESEEKSCGAEFTNVPDVVAMIREMRG